MTWLTRLGFVAPAPVAGHEDHALLARLATGDADALALLYRRESGGVYRYALALTGDEASALDAVQEAFAQLLRGAQGYDAARGSLGAYLAGMARHQVLSQWRDARRHVPLDDALDHDALDHDTATSSDARLHRAQQQQGLWAAIRSLNWPQREALTLVDLQERSYAEAAAIAGVSVDVLRTRLHRARQRLADLLGEGERP